MIALMTASGSSREAVAEARRRWASDAGQARAQAIVARLRSGKSLGRLGLAVHDGRTDLRGLPLPDPVASKETKVGRLVASQVDGLVELRDRRLAGLDLSGARLRSLRLFGCQIDNCRFDGADLEDWRLWDSEIRDSTFCGADLRGSALGSWHDGKRNRWQHVDFSRATLLSTALLTADFTDCNFAHAELKGVQFSQCNLSGCRFEGALVGVLFDGRGLPGRPAPRELNCDFSRTTFSDVEFLGFRLTRVLLPDDPDLVLVPNFERIGHRIAAALADDQSLPARQLRGVITNWLKGLAAATPRCAQTAVVLNRRDWRDWGGSPLDALAERLVADAQNEHGDDPRP
jgi:uncharacterized protein YjbI with pentapeptide repeats